MAETTMAVTNTARRVRLVSHAAVGTAPSPITVGYALAR
jgi:hypothetical protein